MYGMTSPLNLGLPDTQIQPTDQRDQYPVYTGRTIFEQITISNLNRIPVELLKNRTLRGIKADEPPVAPEKVCELLLVEGGAALYLDGGGEWECLENLLSCTDSEIWQLAMAEKENAAGGLLPSEWVYRRFVNNGDVWQVIDIDPDTGKDLQDQPPPIPADAMVVYPNGQGILYPTQWMFQRLEQIRWDIRQETSDFALSMLIIGMVSPNPEDALAKLESGKRIANIPGQGATVERVGDSRVVDQLAAEYQALEAEYFRACHIMDTADQPNRPVGFDLQLRMEPQTAFIETLRRKVIEVYAMLGFTGPITFRRLETMTPADKTAELTNIMTAQDRGYITSQQASEQALALFN